MALESTQHFEVVDTHLQCEWQVLQPILRSRDVLLLLAVQAAGARSRLCSLDTAHPLAKQQREVMRQKMSSSLLLSRRRCDGVGRGILLLGSCLLSQAGVGHREVP